MQLEATVEEYFKKRTEIDSNGCWIWQLGKDRDGYGNCWHPLNVANKKQKAHQLSYLHYHGPIATGLVVRHKCRSRACCNPNHLEIGTQVDNIKDMQRDGTVLFGGKTGRPHSYSKKNT